MINRSRQPRPPARRPETSIASLFILITAATIGGILAVVLLSSEAVEAMGAIAAIGSLGASVLGAVSYRRRDHPSEKD